MGKYLIKQKNLNVFLCDVGTKSAVVSPKVFKAEYWRGAWGTSFESIRDPSILHTSWNTHFALKSGGFFRIFTMFKVFLIKLSLFSLLNRRWKNFVLELLSREKKKVYEGNVWIWARKLCFKKSRFTWGKKFILPTCFLRKLKGKKL